MWTGRGRRESNTSHARPMTSPSSLGSVTVWLKAVTVCKQRLLIGEIVDLAETALGCGDGARHDQHRDRVVIGLGDRRDRVRQPRSADQHADARPPGHAGVAVGHERRSLLVARRHVAQAGRADPAVQLERVDAGNPEHRRHAGTLQQRDQRLAA